MDDMPNPIDSKQAEIRAAHKMLRGASLYRLYRDRPFCAFNPSSRKTGLKYGVERIGAFLELLNAVPLPPGSLVLDIGCGGGWTSEWLARWGYRVISLDIGFEYMAIACERAMESNLESWHTIQGDGENLPFADNTFDAVLYFASLHHMPAPHQSLAETYRILRPGGWVGASEPGNPQRADAFTEVTKRTGIREEGFHPFYLKQQMLQQLGFRRCFLRSHVPQRRSYEKPIFLRWLPIALTGLPLDFLVSLVWVVKIVLFPLGRFNFELVAQK